MNNEDIDCENIHSKKLSRKSKIIAEIRLIVTNGKRTLLN